MKVDIVVYVGAYLASIVTRISLGNLSLFKWWELFFIGCYLLMMAIAGGIVFGMIADAFHRFTDKNTKQWNGRRKGLKPST